MILVINKKDYGASWIASKGGIYIGRPSVLGNPFSHKSGTLAKYKVASRDEAIEKYREWLRAEWLKNGEVKQELLRLARLYRKHAELVLVCWCKPEPCHGDVLAEVIKKIAKTL